MATLRDHLMKFHKEAASHHQNCSECYGKLAGMAKTADAEPGEHFQTLADLHSDHAAFHAECMKACEKSAQDDLNKIVPDGIQGVIPSNPPPRQTIRPVVRVGQPEIDTKGVPVELQHFLKIEL